MLPDALAAPTVGAARRCGGCSSGGCGGCAGGTAPAGGPCSGSSAGSPPVCGQHWQRVGQLDAARGHKRWAPRQPASKLLVHTSRSSVRRSDVGSIASFDHDSCGLVLSCLVTEVLFQRQAVDVQALPSSVCRALPRTFDDPPPAPPLHPQLSPAVLSLRLYISFLHPSTHLISPSLPITPSSIPPPKSLPSSSSSSALPACTRLSPA